jgi:hypothetical protein
MEKAVLDRFEGDWAILLVGDTGRIINVLRISLPETAREGEWLSMELEDGQVISAVLDREETEKVRRRIERKLARLRRGDHLK